VKQPGRQMQALSVPVPPLSRPGSAWAELPRPAAAGAIPAGYARIGYARASTIRQSLDTQMDSLRAAGVTRIFAEKIPPAPSPGRSSTGPWRWPVSYARPGSRSPWSCTSTSGSGEAWSWRQRPPTSAPRWMHSFRQFPLLDPKLPDELMDQPMLRGQAVRLFHELWDGLSGQAPTARRAPGQRSGAGGRWGWLIGAVT
jgi:hypothetical protein